MKYLYGESFIALADSEQLHKVYCQDFCQQYNIDEKNLIYYEQTVIKIEHVRKVKDQLKFRPSSGNFIVIALSNAQNMTVDAANAMLKILEEPPSYAKILLFTNNIYALMPTILSRCKKIKIKNTQKVIVADDYQRWIEKVLEAKRVYEKINLAGQLAKDESILIEKFLKNMIYYLKSVKESDWKNIAIVKKYIDNYKLGVNKKLFIENLFLDLKFG